MLMALNHRMGKIKPLQAYRFVKKIVKSESEPGCLIWLYDILGKQEILHDMKYVESHKK